MRSRTTTEPSTARSESLEPQAPSRFRPDIEGLRALAVLLVVLYHAGVPELRGGFIGVDVFFVISGFLITGLLVHERETSSSISLVHFYARRARRILPAGMLVIALTIIAAHHFQNFVTFASTAQDGRWAALFAANIHYAVVGTNYFAQGQAPSPLLHFWSLAVEEQFYVVWPAAVIAVLLLARGRSIRVAIGVAAGVIATASFAWAIIELRTDPVWAYYSPLTRAWELALGAVLATIGARTAKRSPRFGTALGVCGLIAICLSAILYDNSTHFPGLPALLPVLGASAVIIGGISTGGSLWPLGLPPVRAVGRVSYGWYLLHYPPMILLAGVLWRGPLSVDENLLIALVTLGAAFLMYEVLEKPVRYSQALRNRPWSSIGLGLCFVALAFLVSSFVHKSL